jgi:hypothetical protein
MRVNDNEPDTVKPAWEFSLLASGVAIALLLLLVVVVVVVGLVVVWVW